MFVNVKALQFDTKVIIKMENFSSSSNKQHSNHNDVKISSEMEANTKLNKSSSIAFLSNLNVNQNKCDKFSSEYSCKLLHSSSNLQNMKNEEKPLDFKKVY